MAAHEIYAEVLTGRKHGYPLWNPSPTEDLRNMSPGSPKAIQLGDVGYVFRGSFHRLFNIHLPEQHDDQGKFLPEYFVPLDVSPLPLRRSTRPGPETISSTNTRVTKVSAEAGSPGFGGLHLLVKPTRKSSAALHFVEDAFFEDVPNPGEYKKYTLEHGESWYKLAKDLKLGIGPGEMMLITGRTMTNTWANIAFADTTSEFEVVLQVDHQPVGIGATCSIQWSSVNGAERNWGPRCAVSVPVITEPAGPSRPLDTVNSQCIFFRHAQFMSRRWFGIKMRAKGEDKELFEGGQDDDDDGSAGLASSDCEEKPHYLTQLLEYILKNSDADHAIAHDDDLLAFLESIEAGVDLGALLDEKQPAILVDMHGPHTFAQLAEPSPLTFDHAPPRMSSASEFSAPVPHRSPSSRSTSPTPASSSSSLPQPEDRRRRDVSMVEEALDSYYPTLLSNPEAKHVRTQSVTEAPSRLSFFPTAFITQSSPHSPHPNVYGFSSTQSPLGHAPHASVQSPTADKGKSPDRSYQIPPPPRLNTLNAADVPQLQDESTLLSNNRKLGPVHTFSRWSRLSGKLNDFVDATSSYLRRLRGNIDNGLGDSTDGCAVESHPTPTPIIPPAKQGSVFMTRHTMRPSQGGKNRESR